MRLLLAFALLVVAVYATSDIIPNSYIIVFQHYTPDHVVQRHMNNLTNVVAWRADNKIQDNYRINFFVGYSAFIHDSQTIDHLRTLPEVRYIEADRVVYKACDVQPAATWGLARTSSPTYDPIGAYVFPAVAGEGTVSYIIDTGIQTNHDEFQGRAILGASFIPGTTSEDDNGHGTHVAGTVVGQVYGIAKKGTVCAVKVLSSLGSGSNAGVISGINWVASNADPKKGNVANMSLGGSFNTGTNEAVAALVKAGVTTVVAAGNNNADACFYSPASTADAITVAASTSSDIRASFSNWGTCVDLTAPGNAITSAYWSRTSTSLLASLSGTSMASPHVAGVVAVYLSKYPSATPAQVKSWIKTRTAPVVDDLRGSPQGLLQQGCYD